MDFTDQSPTTFSWVSRGQFTGSSSQAALSRLADGANYIQAGSWRGFAIRDGNLITGQQNFSDTETAEAIASALGK
ncbi:MAG TPA: hypothetical protein VER98_01410 [Terriglobia bacterium]|nr:hypothetical protein [Terriglobia bacterium]